MNKTKGEIELVNEAIQLFMDERVLQISERIEYRYEKIENNIFVLEFVIIQIIIKRLQYN